MNEYMEHAGRRIAEQLREVGDERKGLREDAALWIETVIKESQRAELQAFYDRASRQNMANAFKPDGFVHPWVRSPHT